MPPFYVGDEKSNESRRTPNYSPWQWKLISLHHFAVISHQLGDLDVCNIHSGDSHTQHIWHCSSSKNMKSPWELWESPELMVEMRKLFYARHTRFESRSLRLCLATRKIIVFLHTARKLRSNQRCKKTNSLAWLIAFFCLLAIIQSCFSPFAAIIYSPRNRISFDGFSLALGGDKKAWINHCYWFIFSHLFADAKYEINNFVCSFKSSKRHRKLSH